MKKLTAACAALTLTLSLGASASAAPLLISGNPGYSGAISINGEALDVSGLPAAPAGAVSLPLRAVTEADYGFADWYPEEAKSYFALDTNRVYVSTTDGAIEVNGQAVTGMTATFVEGVTYVPVGLLNHLEGYKAEVKGSDITVTTPNGEALTKLARSIIDKADMGASMKPSADELKEFYGIDPADFEHVVGFFPMMISADTVVIGQVKDGRMDAVKEALEAQRAKTQQGFEQYLPEPLERAKNGQVVTSGDYVMLIISGDNDTAIQMFKDGVK